VIFGYLQREGVIEGFALQRGQFLPTVARVTVLVAGSFFVHWLAELITENGIGDGRSILLLGGIAARLPVYVGDLIREDIEVTAFVLAALCVALWVSIVVSGGERRIPVHYITRRLSRRTVKLPTRYLSIRVNRVGTDPLQASLGAVATLGLWAIPVAGLGIPGISRAAAAVAGMLKGTSGFWVLYTLGTFLYGLYLQDLSLEGKEIANHLSRTEGVVGGQRPGPRTGQYLEMVSDRVAMVGVLYHVAMALYPYVLGVLTGMESTVFDAALAVLLGFDTILDTMQSLVSELRTHHYDSFIR
jgi:preprotein translocase subunit SecY